MEKNYDLRLSELDSFVRCQMKTREIVHSLGLNEYVADVTFNDLAFFDKFLRDKPIQFILHDSDSNTQHVRDFFDLCFPYVMKGGWLAVHDYVIADYSNVIPGVNEFLDKMGDAVTPYMIYSDSLVLIRKNIE